MLAYQDRLIALAFVNSNAFVAHAGGRKRVENFVIFYGLPNIATGLNWKYTLLWFFSSLCRMFRYTVPTLCLLRGHVGVRKKWKNKKIRRKQKRKKRRDRVETIVQWKDCRWCGTKRVPAWQEGKSKSWKGMGVNYLVRLSVYLYETNYLCICTQLSPILYRWQALIVPLM